MEVFPAPSAILMGFITFLEAPGILLRIYSDLLRSAGNGVRPPRTDSGFPTPGVRMTVVYTNSPKLAYSRPDSRGSLLFPGSGNWK